MSHNTKTNPRVAEKGTFATMLPRRNNWFVPLLTRTKQKSDPVRHRASLWSGTRTACVLHFPGTSCITLCAKGRTRKIRPRNFAHQAMCVCCTLFAFRKMPNHALSLVNTCGVWRSRMGWRLTGLRTTCGGFVHLFFR